MKPKKAEAEEVELDFEPAYGYRSSSRARYDAAKMRTLISQAHERLLKNKDEIKRLMEAYKKEPDANKRIALQTQIGKLALPVEIKLTTLEAYLQTEISNSDNFAWTLNPKNKASHFRELVGEMIVGKMKVGARFGKKGADDVNKKLMGITFRLLDG